MVFHERHDTFVGFRLGKKELQDIAAAQKQSRRVKTNQSYTYADKKFWVSSC